MNTITAEKNSASDGKMRGYRPMSLVKRPLGRILVDGKFVSEEQLLGALAEQRHTNERLGEILIRFGELDQTDLKIALSFQEDLADPVRAAQLTAGVRRMLGEILLQAHRIAPEQLDAALQEQQRTGEKLGEILVRLGLLNQRELDAALIVQQHQANPPPLANRLRLGEILVSAGYISRPQLEEVLARQVHTKQRLGDLLVEAGHAQPHHIEHGMRLQAMLLAAALTAALTMFSNAATVEAKTAPEHQASARVMVSAVIPARASINILNQTPEIIVTDADVHRGFVEVADSTQIQLKNNSPKGCLLIFETQDLPFKDATVIINGREVSIGPGGGMLDYPNMGTVTLPLSFRFALSEDMHPGTYAWPFILSVRTL